MKIKQIDDELCEAAERPSEEHQRPDPIASEGRYFELSEEQLQLQENPLTFV
ncbi:MAG: hypothetical protein M3222_04380 [Thermoproteota archaeon]|nr:hypothetical protein [Thermoproteota archaeon]MDQ3984374.1 hypothetical protein [Thermoproteota archaeon]MDQ4022902.1 hypothetical protein [Thermoproteota archaeon]